MRKETGNPSHCCCDFYIPQVSPGLENEPFGHGLETSELWTLFFL